MTNGSTKDHDQVETKQSDSPKDKPDQSGSKEPIKK